MVTGNGKLSQPQSTQSRCEQPHPLTPPHSNPHPPAPSPLVERGSTAVGITPAITPSPGQGEGGG